MATTIHDTEGTRIGADGVLIKAVRSGTASINFPAGSATVGDIVEATATITGAAVGDVIVANPGAAVAADVVWNVVSVEANTVRLRATQGTASQDAAATNFTYLWFDLT